MTKKKKYHKIRGTEIVVGSSMSLPVDTHPLQVDHILYYPGGSIDFNEKTQGVVMRSISRLCHMATICLERNIPVIGGIDLHDYNLQEIQIQMLGDEIEVVL